MPASPWFVAPPQQWGAAEIVLDEPESHHALRVLRLQASDELTITDGRGMMAVCVLRCVRDGRVVAEITGRETRLGSRPRIAVYQAAAKHPKVDAVIERLAEIGAAEVAVYSSERAVVKWAGAKIDRMAGRWEMLSRSAAKQSRNPWQTTVGPLLSWSGLIERIRAEPFAVALWEDASERLRTALGDPPERVAVVVGPEGGLTRAEAWDLASAGARLVSLGPLIVRTENAALVAASALLYHYGILG